MGITLTERVVYMHEQAVVALDGYGSVYGASVAKTQLSDDLDQYESLSPAAGRMGLGLTPVKARESLASVLSAYYSQYLGQPSIYDNRFDRKEWERYSPQSMSSLNGAIDEFFRDTRDAVHTAFLRYPDGKTTVRAKFNRIALPASKKILTTFTDADVQRAMDTVSNKALKV